MTPQVIRNLSPRLLVQHERVPILKILRSLTWVQWALFFSGWLAWTFDAIDLFIIAFNTPHLQTLFHQHGIIPMAVAVSCSFLFRILGSFFFGILADRFGRKWLLVAILLFCSPVQFITAFVQDFMQFFALRIISGFAMGGIWGLAASPALENIPVDARGLASGVLQSGYAFAYIITSVLNLFLISNNHHTWRVLYQISAGIAALVAVIRAVIPESEAFLRAQAQKRARGERDGEGAESFGRKARLMLKKNWRLFVFASIMVAVTSTVVHASQDLYPTYLTTIKGFTTRESTLVAMLGSCGAITGSVIAGSASQFIGRRLTVIVFVLFGAAFIPLWIIPSTVVKLCIGTFWLQFGVQGAMGVMPILVAELSPPGFCATYLGLAYQAANFLAAGAGQIQTILAGARHLKKTTIVDGESKTVPGYVAGICIILGWAMMVTVKFSVIGQENHGSRFERDNSSSEEAFPATITSGPRQGSMEEEKYPSLTRVELDIFEKI
ncbi:carboxylic acid transporter protein [Multifurca ochricompacta]|uniref:Carboxylic acid transporter protein n=1 Tax=Multifurca ochricompacta TaxID=376703 RepID=A0AAD4QFC2_9AGAM|nr:carboxylic acid transporter protein [Multifurca ochricompacta]KAI0293881.1 carboxylic acid transporter protein [Multifurca ochricompacta]